MSNGKYHKVIGIDLGTTYSAVAVYNKDDETTMLIPDRSTGMDEETTPSVISLDTSNLNRVIVGSAAKRNIAIKPQDTILEVKREMGEMFTQEILKRLNAEGVFSVDDPVKFFFAGQWFLPQEISAFTLMKMKEIAEREIGEEIRDAVVTVPAYFTEKQKKATGEAALLAGLYPRQLIPEPTAAAICYCDDKQEEEKKVYLVYDLGGGTFDVSVIQMEGEKIEVISTSGDPRLGGADFDNAITEWAISELKNLDINIANDHLAKARIRERAERVKILLSTSNSAILDLSFLNPQNPPSLPITRDLFYSLINGFLGKTKDYVNTALTKAAVKGIQRDDVDAILLVGGSSKIPIIKEMLLEYFGKEGNFVRSGINPDSVVARGAALMAKRFAPSPPPFDIKKKKENTLRNVDVDDDMIVHLITEHTLGIGVQDNLVAKIVAQGTSIPVEVRQGGFVNGGPTDNIPVAVYQGEGKYTYENTLIGTLQIGPMELKPANYHQFEVLFKLDVNGLISMTIIHINENKTYEAKFEQKTGVGGEDALVAIRNKLLKLYLRSVDIPIPHPTRETQAAVVVPPPAPVDQQRDAGVIPSPSRVSQTQHEQGPIPGDSRDQGTAVVSAHLPPNWDEQKSSVVIPGPVPNPAGVIPAMGNEQQPTQQISATEDIVEPVVAIPDQFKQVVRRSRKLLVKSFDNKLVKALNTFTAALNAGHSEDDLEDLGDALADVYEDVKKL